MTVYVDDMKAPYRRMIMCHMVADSEEELHEMARRIGVARRWYQGDHYDICLSKRAAAVFLGAKEITMRELGAMVAVRKKTGDLGDPSTALARWRDLRAKEKAGTNPASHHNDGERASAIS